MTRLPLHIASYWPLLLIWLPASVLAAAFMCWAWFGMEDDE